MTVYSIIIFSRSFKNRFVHGDVERGFLGDCINPGSAEPENKEQVLLFIKKVNRASQVGNHLYYQNKGQTTWL